MGIDIRLHWYKYGAKKAVELHQASSEFADGHSYTGDMYKCIEEKFPEFDGKWDLKDGKADIEVDSKIYEGETWGWFSGSFMPSRGNHELNILAGEIDQTPFGKIPVKALPKEMQRCHNGDLYYIFDYNTIASDDNNCYLIPDWKQSLQRALEIKEKVLARMSDEKNKTTEKILDWGDIPKHEKGSKWFEYCMTSPKKQKKFLKSLPKKEVEAIYDITGCKILKEDCDYALRVLNLLIEMLEYINSQDDPENYYFIWL